MSSSLPIPIYFEQSWSILSSIGLLNILFGIAIIRLTSLSPISLVPIIISAASALANGLCYYAYYTNSPQTSLLIAAIFAEISWLIQEAGLLFYSHLILTQLLHNKPRLIYTSLFWIFITALTLLRIAVLTCRIYTILYSPSPTSNPTYNLIHLTPRLHIPYFLLIASTELLSCYFLLRKLSSAKRASMHFTNSSTLFNYLMRSTQIRASIITIIGVGRAITYCFRRGGIQAGNIAGEIDRFLYVGECLFPIVMFIDILSSKLFVSNQSLNRSRNPSPGPPLTYSPSPSPYASPTPSPYRHPSPSPRHPSHRHHRQPSPEMRLVTHIERDIEEANMDANSVEIFDERGRGVEIDGEEIDRERARERDTRGRGYRSEYVISQDVVDFSSDASGKTWSTDFEFLVGRVDAHL